jgi:C4-dicarboxylate-specific signal transduction histidine kinase
MGIEIADRYEKVGHGAVLNLSLCKLYTKISKFDSARVYGRRAYKLYMNYQHKNGLASLFKTLGRLSFKEGDYYQAQKYYTDALEIANELDHTWLISEISQKLAELHIAKDNKAIALPLLNRSYTLAREMGAKDLVLNCYFSYSNLFEKSNDHQMALKYHKLYSNLRDSLFVINQSEITDLQINHYTEQVQKEKELLQKNNSILFLEAEKQKLLNTRLLFAFIILGLISIIIFLLYQRKKDLNKILENNINQAMIDQNEQNQIIIHQAGLTSLGEMVASIAHDVNQPLQNITLCLENIAMENKNSDLENIKITENLKEMDDLLNRIHNTIDHIRLFSSRQKEDIHREFSINHSIENAFLLLDKKFRKEKIHITLDLCEELPSAFGNPYKFEQAILNLVSNSGDATIAKKKLSVNGYIPHIIIQTLHSSAQITIKIFDNGIGIPEENREHIFLPFYSTKKLGDGQGLGLTISHRILEEFNGKIKLDSENGLGTTAIVTLPLNK